MIGGVGTACAVTVTPLANRNGGLVTISLIVTDAGTPAPNLTANTTFQVTVTAIDDAPTISVIADQAISENTSAVVNFTINDIDNVLNCTTSMAATSTNATLIPVSGVVFSGTAPNCTATVTPLADQNGTADLTFTVSDGALTASALFMQTVTAQNDAPVISALTAQSTRFLAATGGGGGGGGGVNGGSTSAATGGRGGTCSASYAGGPTGQFGSFNGLVGASTLGGAGVNPANAADGNRGGAGRGEDGTAGTNGLIYMIWP